MRIQRIRPGAHTVTPAEQAPDPKLGHGVIAKERYTSKEFMELEWERMWKKVWLMACREDGIPEPGDYYVHEIGKQSILVIRQPSGQVRAFYNVCQHRGNLLAPSGYGHRETFKCMYHHWEYALDGKYRRIPDIETFPQGAPCSGGLVELPCDTWGSFVWFSMDQDAGPLRDFLGEMPQHLDSYHFERMIQTRDWTVEWDCNWKAAADAFNETYHVQGIHPELLYYLNDYDVQVDTYDRHSRYLVPFATLSPRVTENTEIPPFIKLIMEGAHLDPASYSDRVAEARKAIQAWKRQHGAEQGWDYSDLNDDQLTDDYHYSIFPNIQINIHADDLLMFRHRPHPTDPDKMLYDLWNFRLPEKTDKPYRRPKHQHFKHGDKSLGLVLDQDAHNLPHVQFGMHSDGFDGLWLSEQELRIRHFHKVIDDYLQKN